MDFVSDNWAGASDKVMDALVAANAGMVPAYGADAITQRLERRMCELFERDVAVLLVTTGTAANSLAITSHCPPHGAIVCHRSAHINTDECGAPEFFGSNKLIGLGGAAAKIDPDALAALLSRPTRGVHHVIPSVLSITQATELGAVYSLAEVRRLADIAKAAGLAVHMDGARLANAAVRLKATPAELTWKAGVDVLTFGATKGGCLMAEAIVLFDPGRYEQLAFLRKRSGQLVSKHRLVSAQFDAWLDGGHWLELAAHANAMAERLAAGMTASTNARIVRVPEANEVFAYLTPDVAGRLKAAGAQFGDWDSSDLEPEERAGEGEGLYRFVTSFRTTAEDVDRFVGHLG